MHLSARDFCPFLYLIVYQTRQVTTRFLSRSLDTSGDNTGLKRSAYVSGPLFQLHIESKLVISSAAFYFICVKPHSSTSKSLNKYPTLNSCSGVR